MITRKYATTLKDSVFDLIISILKRWEIYKYCKVNLSNYTITLSNESVILFKGLDDEEKIKSILDITDIWMEEATEFTEDEFTQLDLRVREQKSPTSRRSQASIPCQKPIGFTRSGLPKTQ